MALRELVVGVLGDLGDRTTHSTLADACERLGLPTPIPHEAGSKRERVRSSLAALADADLPTVAERVLLHERLDATTRNAVQDALWALRSTVAIPKKARREIARALDVQDLVLSGGRLRDLLDQLWVLDDPLSFADLLGAALRGLRREIDRHVFRNPGDWSTEELFERLGAFEAGDARFARFLEGLVSPDVIPDEPGQRYLVDVINQHLRAAGVELRETREDGGYPIFQAVASGLARTRRPKNLVFASLAKPDLRLSGALDNDIEIVTNADKVLIYDRPIPADGLRWRDLQDWWRDTHQLAGDDEAKTSLYARLRQCLPANSTEQRNLHELYHEIHGSAVPNLPVLLPEVWLHWDPKTVEQRGADALLRQRMDFLLLLPHGQRVVLEVDGSQHFTTPDGRPDGTTYAATMQADRDLKLRGYEVFHFGTAELRRRDEAHAMLQQFFAELFRRFEVNRGTA
ncbi:AbiJ-related protein [Streptomyces millisiae]|uniref:AbiJ-NTD3 domain-containing protein n=1 Tax=Streptomyces millisiae TaxID=3075542 RepID=A0ABU2LV35_9ACTN|nr:hypothetical protein [Streptomyces sp. DSM 44918]MDT0321444.1 hypothetical protein [Streptomyces sp. DSM 44918]